MAEASLSPHQPRTLAKPTSTSNSNPTSEQQQPLTATSNPQQGPLALNKNLRNVRNNSLRRVKDSHEQLRARSARTRAPSHVPQDASANGRSFTVGSIKPNGIIYLRPTIRPGNQRTSVAPPPPLQPSKPLVPRRERDTRTTSFLSDSPSPPPFVTSPPPPTVEKVRAPNPLRSASHRHARPRGHTRSQSQNALEETSVVDEEEKDIFRDLADRPTSIPRPKSAESGPQPLLKVPIPHYRLGTPRFSVRGTPTLRSSIYTRGSGTEDALSSIYSPISPDNETKLFLTPPGHASFTSRRHSEAFGYQPNRPPLTMRPSARTSQATIDAALFEKITANPNDTRTVRLNSLGEIVAATPSRLVAHITSPDFLDYELLSDFFLTFRAFLSSTDLAEYLIARLQWAVYRKDEFGKIVRVRTFVAIRHWILNYFVDDFIPDYALRHYFCITVNHLYKTLKARPGGTSGDSNIVGELKKCWRRTCAQFWEPETGADDSIDANITPGGWAPASPTLKAVDSETFDALVVHVANPDAYSAKEDHTAIRNHLESLRQAGQAPPPSMATMLPSPHSQAGALVPLSPVSDTSLKVLSCSIPTRNRLMQGAANLAMHPHPVAAPALVSNATVSTPKASHSQHRHKRSGSFSDALRDARAPSALSQNGPPQVTTVLTNFVPGSLVRGAVFQPSSPYVEFRASTNANRRSPLDLNIPELNIAYNTARLFPASNQSLKRIIGSVRRALSSKPQAPPIESIDRVLGQKANAAHGSQVKSKSATDGSQTDGSETSLTRQRRSPRLKPQPVRVDHLAARVGETFRRAIAEEVEMERDGGNSLLVANMGGLDSTLRHSAQITGARRETKTTNHTRLRSGVTDGSRSILIFDDTGPPPVPMMSGALPLDMSNPASNFSRPLGAKIVAPSAMQDPTADLHLAAEPPSVDIEEQLQAHGGLAIDLKAESEADFSRNLTASTHDNMMRAVSMASSSIGAAINQRHAPGTPSSNRPASSLRRYASYQSGMSRLPGRTSAHLRTISHAYSESSNNDPFQYEEGPVHTLKRRPGGNLRKADHVNDLVKRPRRHSIGSMSVDTESLIMSFQAAKQINDPCLRAELAKASLMESAFSDGQNVPRRRISLIETHSSQPNMRPSFEIEVAKLAALPDFVEDDEGIETALMKLEGRYENRSSRSRESETEAGIESSQVLPFETTENQVLADRPLTPPTHAPVAATTPVSHRGPARLGDSSIAASEDSYNSVPVLERGLSTEVPATSRTQVHSPVQQSHLQPLSPRQLQLPNSPRSPRSPHTGHSSVASSPRFVEAKDSPTRRQLGVPTPHVSLGQSSFLLADNQEFSEHSSDVLASFYDESDEERDDDAPVGSNNEQAFSDKYMVHPLRHPPTPPATAGAEKVSIKSSSATSLERSDITSKLPTPGLTPPMHMPETMTAVAAVREPESPRPPPPTIRPQAPTPNHSRDTSDGTGAHLPFILAYNSEKLAQQFTIIEKDALDEIDWKELIELRWKQSSPNITDWVTYLRTQDPHGVDIVIARFNLMVKWALSQIVLTTDLHERVCTVVKLIHVAVRCRTLHNYATMYQLTIALLSSDCARLTQTWAQIPAVEQQSLAELEVLVQPLRNFHALRVEMETLPSDAGCIPFIGIYTRDLIYNAQKPAFIGERPGDGGEHLVNFERCRTAAMVVKSLLRLLEASGRYQFGVQKDGGEPEVLARCLWIAGLSEEEITRRSRELES